MSTNWLPRSRELHFLVLYANASIVLDVVNSGLIEMNRTFEVFVIPVSDVDKTALGWSDVSTTRVS